MLKNTTFLRHWSWPWVLAFVILNLVVRGTGGHNENSRLAMMRSMSESGKFEISDYKHWTDDWAINKKGEIFSNKAPGPALVGLPLFFIIDKAALWIHLLKGKKRDEYIKEAPTVTPRIILSFFMQVLPYGLLVLWILSYLESQGIGPMAINWTALALLFGNTAIIFLNTYFGHGMASMFLLAMMMGLLLKNYKGIGFFYGMTLLSEYTASILFLPLLICLYLMKNKPKKWWVSFILGGVVPGLLWIWYHSLTFGGPFSTAIQNQNPMFLDMAQKQNNLWGVFSLIPNWKILYEIILGSKRGIFFTVPWILIMLPFLVTKIFYKDNFQKLSVNGIILWPILGLLMLIYANSSFGSWHSGASAGPRYICLIFPIFSLLGGMIYQNLNWLNRCILWIGLLVAVIFRGQVFATTILAPLVDHLWTWQWDWILEGPNSAKAIIRLAIYYPCLMVAGYFVLSYKKLKTD